MNVKPDGRSVLYGTGKRRFYHYNVEAGSKFTVLSVSMEGMNRQRSTHLSQDQFKISKANPDGHERAE